MFLCRVKVGAKTFSLLIPIERFLVTVRVTARASDPINFMTLFGENASE